MKQAGHNQNTRNSNTRTLGEVVKKYAAAMFLPRMHCVGQKLQKVVSIQPAAWKT